MTSRLLHFIGNVNLPQGAEKPKIMIFGMAAIPEYTLAVYGESYMNQQQVDFRSELENWRDTP
jgi:hypothetical protein